MLDGDGTIAKGPFVEELSGAIGKLLSQQRHPFLIGEGVDEDVDVALADVFHLRIIFWKRFRHILRYGLAVHGGFRDLLVSFERLHYQTPIVHREMNPLPDSAEPETAWPVFKEAYERFTDAYKASLASIFNDQTLDPDRVHNAFNVLFKEARGKTRLIVKRALVDFEDLSTNVDLFRQGYHDLQERYEKDKDGDHRALVTHAKAQINVLADLIEKISKHSSEMMVGLLKLIGGDEPIEKEHNGGAQSHFH
jgi:hypothetical protein